MTQPIPVPLEPRELAIAAILSTGAAADHYIAGPPRYLRCCCDSVVGLDVSVDEVVEVAGFLGLDLSNAALGRPMVGMDLDPNSAAAADAAIMVTARYLDETYGDDREFVAPRLAGISSVLAVARTLDALRTDGDPAELVVTRSTMQALRDLGVGDDEVDEVVEVMRRCEGPMRSSG